MRRGCPNACGVAVPGEDARTDSPKGAADLVVVGMGPAGVACVLQAAREGLRVVAIADQPAGGLLPAARRLDNLPGWPGGVGGAVLARRMARQVAACPATLVPGTVVSLRPGPGGFEVGLQDGRCLATRTVCVASGTRPAPLPWRVAGDAMPARDVRDLPRGLAGRRVVVIGGGDAAFDTALTAADRGAEVVVLVRGKVPRAAPGLLGEAAAAGIDLRVGVFVDALSCFRGMWRVLAGPGGELTADHVVACVGRVPRDDLIQGIDGHAGAFVAGDVHRGAQRFAALAMGDGQAAALAAVTAIRGRGDERRR